MNLIKKMFLTAIILFLPANAAYGAAADPVRGTSGVVRSGVVKGKASGRRVQGVHHILEDEVFVPYSKLFLRLHSMFFSEKFSEIREKLIDYYGHLYEETVDSSELVDFVIEDVWKDDSSNKPNIAMSKYFRRLANLLRNEWLDLDKDLLSKFLIRLRASCLEDFVEGAYFSIRDPDVIHFEFDYSQVYSFMMETFFRVEFRRFRKDVISKFSRFYEQPVFNDEELVCRIFEKISVNPGSVVTINGLFQPLLSLFDKIGVQSDFLRVAFVSAIIDRANEKILAIRYSNNLRDYRTRSSIRDVSAKGESHVRALIKKHERIRAAREEADRLMRHDSLSRDSVSTDSGTVRSRGFGVKSSRLMRSK